MTGLLRKRPNPNCSSGIIKNLLPYLKTLRSTLRTFWIRDRCRTFVSRLGECFGEKAIGDGGFSVDTRHLLFVVVLFIPVNQKVLIGSMEIA